MLEKVESEFIAKELKHIQKKIYRINHQGKRFYISDPEQKIHKLLPSVTTILNAVIPESEGFKLLRQQWGADFNKIMNEKAHKGTLIHEILSNYLQDKSYDISSLENQIYNYLQAYKLNYDVKSWLYELQPKVISLMQFCYDYQVVPLATELPVINNMYAGTLDLLAYITVEELQDTGKVFKSGARKGEPKLEKVPIQKLAIIDFKSGTGGFYDSYKYQLMMYKDALNEVFQCDDAVLMNVSPKEFATGNFPNYTAKKWHITNQDKQTLDLYLKLFNLQYKEPEKFKVFSGRIENNDNPRDLLQYVDKDTYINSLYKVELKQR